MKTRCTFRTAVLAGLAGLVLIFAACGGGGGGGTTPTQNPVPVLTSISPAAGNMGGGNFMLTANGSSFISSSVIRWNGSNRLTEFVNSTQLTAGISAADLAASGTAQVTVFNPAPGGGTSVARTFTINAVSALVIETSALPPTSGGKAYDFALGVSGGIPPLGWGVTAGDLPAGLTLNGSTGVISGTVSPVASDTIFNFTVQVTDSAATPSVDSRALTLTVRAGSLGSNNTRAGANPISNGTIAATISPYGDEDFYSFHATAGNTITVEIMARRLSPSSQLDSAIEIQDSGGTRPSTGCRSPDHPFDFVNFVVVDPTPNAFDDECVNDDIELGVTQDSLLEFKPQTTGTYFVHVVDLRGDGRPDLNYELTLSGAD